ncbi:cornifelin homolog B-like [Sphaeramia orbicularis]|uniref:Cornifelin homolog B-like n=1 Tax=Sphaeramia orbicularis TaxID=375764 RepID=A0A673CCX6_9TELE|nr:cornifelin homolog B-like [Sphaeramia orbicularis]
MASKLLIQQPQPVMVVQDSDEWGSGICDCFEDLPECCFGFWCLPCFACRTSKKFGEDLCIPLLELFFGGLIPPITMSMRVAMRYRYGIKGSMCMDCVYSTFCAACSWCQMAREIRRRDLPIVLVNARHK